jgi:hypothetical protein
VWALTLLRILATAALLGFSACSGNFSVGYQPTEGIALTVSVEKVAWNAERNSTFVHAGLVLENNTGTEVTFNVGDVSAMVDGTQSVATYYDSVASVMPSAEQVGPGRREYSIYFVFATRLSDVSDGNFRLVTFGLPDG